MRGVAREAIWRWTKEARRQGGPERWSWFEACFRGSFRAGTGCAGGLVCEVALGCLWMGVRMGSHDASLGGPWDACGPLAVVFERAARRASDAKARFWSVSFYVARRFVDGRANCRSEKRFRNDASASKDKTCLCRLRRSERAFAGRQATCSEQAAILSPRAGRWAHRRRRAVQTTPQRRLPRGDRRRRPPARVRRRKKETAAGAVEPRLGPANSGREAASG